MKTYNNIQAVTIEEHKEIQSAPKERDILTPFLIAKETIEKSTQKILRSILKELQNEHRNDTSKLWRLSRASKNNRAINRSCKHRQKNKRTSKRKNRKNKWRRA